MALNANGAQAHYNYALALGRINENASSKQKIANAKLIKKECDDAVRLDPKLAGAYHILGRWHRTIAGFNFAEKANLLEPDVMIHKYELAQSYAERDEKGDDIVCKVWCKKVLEMTAKDDDDKDTQTKAHDLVKKVE